MQRGLSLLSNAYVEGGGVGRGGGTSPSLSGTCSLLPHPLLLGNCSWPLTKLAALF